MAARPMASATISFGLVSIPCKLFPTVDNTSAVRFNYLSKDGSRLRQQYIRASDGEIVEREDRVQGYEFAKGQYVTFTADELKALNVVATNAIDIDEFIPLADVERVFIERVYYLGPDKGAARSYHLLRAALGKTGRAALARYAARGKSYLVLIRPMGEALVMEQLKHADELRKVDEVPLDVCDVNDGELDLAVQIIAQRTNDKFEPENYQDEVKNRVLELIQQKIDGQDIAVAPEEKAEAKIIDLMEALRQSVADRGGADKEAKRGRPAKRASGKRASEKQPSGGAPAAGDDKTAASGGEG
ncbi:MAG: Ku protein [Gammaproteobacteria bacterium]|nr:Ku protein [Gammaproteobacteria bacterium]MYF30622.1 Ku protein [Gammaproteobacteria bacterium]MYK46595.1 Ku protein [Gammaproteobacteria bacterium]